MRGGFFLLSSAHGLNMFGLGNQAALEVKGLEAPSWTELATRIPAEDLNKGPLNVRASIRTFDSRDQDPSVTLYRDSAAWCPYCHKTLMLLEEKALPYKVEKINMACYGDKPRSFLQLQPSGTLPAALFEGEVLRSSDAIILATLESPSTKGADLDVRSDARTRSWLDLERQHFSAWLRWLTGGDGGKGYFIATLDRVEAELASTGGPFFFGDRFTFVDIMYAPFLERMAASLAYFKGFVTRAPSDGIDKGDPDLDAWRKYPALNKWFDAMESRESYRATMSDWYTHAHDLPPQLGGCVSARTAAAEAVRADVNGGCWRDQPPKFEPLWSWIDKPRFEAGARLAANGPAVAKFAARGAAGPGFPPVRAPLADPNASPNDRFLPLVDAALRQVARNLLDDCDSTDYTDLLRVASLEDSDAKRLANCFLYLRDRVGVPRDMSFPAARLLRVECNRLVSQLQPS